MIAFLHPVHPSFQPQSVAEVRSTVAPNRRVAFDRLLNLLQLDAVGTFAPQVPVDEIDDAGFGTEWRWAAERANKKFGFQGSMEEIEEAARFRNFEFQRIVAAQLRPRRTPVISH